MDETEWLQMESLALLLGDGSAPTAQILAFVIPISRDLGWEGGGGGGGLSEASV